MTIYRNPWNAPSKRKKRRMWRKSGDASYKARANYAYGNQWKRYPRCRNIVDLQIGNKTHTYVIPERSYQLYRNMLSICLPGRHDFEIGRLGDSRTPWNLCRRCAYHEPIYDSGSVTIEISDAEGNRVNV